MNAFTTRLSVATVATALAVVSLATPAGALGSSELSSAPPDCSHQKGGKQRPQIRGGRLHQGIL